MCKCVCVHTFICIYLFNITVLYNASASSRETQDHGPHFLHFALFPCLLVRLFVTSMYCFCFVFFWFSFLILQTFLPFSLFLSLTALSFWLPFLFDIMLSDNKTGRMLIHFYRFILGNNETRFISEPFHQKKS